MDERSRADDLDRFLDDLVSGRPSDATGVDSDIADLARRYQALGDRGAPAGARARVWNRLGHDTTPTVRPRGTGLAAAHGRATTKHAIPAIAQPDMRRSRVTPRTPVGRGRFTPTVAMAALIVLIVASSYFAITSIRGGDHHPRSLPAAVVTTTPPRETVLTTTLAAADIPINESGTASSGLVLFTIPVGAHSTWEPTCCPGPMIEYVLDGIYGVRAQAPLTLVRANGRVEEIAAGTEATLAAGDSLISRNETVVETWNAGTVPTRLLNWMFIDGATGHLVPNWHADQSDIDLNATLPHASAVVTLQRVTVPSGVELSLEPVDGLRCILPDPKRSDGTIFRRTDGSISKIKAGPGSPFVVYLLTVDAAATSATPLTGAPELTPTP
jgi:hypothetical protein